MKIHPTAIIEDGSQLGEDVEVGAHALIGPEAIIGNGCVIQANAVVIGPVSMGERNLIGFGAVIGAAPQDLSHHPGIQSRVRIGDRNTFREHVTIHRGALDGSETVVGDDNFLMVGTHIGHNGRVGNRTIIANQCLLAGHVEIHDGAVLGGGAMFHQFMRVGRLTMIRGGARLGKDVPPFTVADDHNLLCGINVIGLRRNAISPASRMEIKRAYRTIFRGSLSVREALTAALAEDWGDEAREFLEFIQESRRGVSTANVPRRGLEREGDAAE